MMWNFSVILSKIIKLYPTCSKKVSDMLFEEHVEGEHLNDSIIFLIK